MMVLWCFTCSSKFQGFGLSGGLGIPGLGACKPSTREPSTPPLRISRASRASAKSLPVEEGMRPKSLRLGEEARGFGTLVTLVAKYCA